MEKPPYLSSCDFEDLVKNRHFYVDKSLLIESIVRKQSGAFLFTRPKGFGKSTNLHMLDHFFNSEYKNESVFEDLRISRTSLYKNHLHQYKVINLDLEYIDSDSFDLVHKNLLKLISTIAEQFTEIGNNEGIGDYEQKLFNRMRFCKIDDAELPYSIMLLSKWISSTYHQETVILIDDYDEVFKSAILNVFYDELASFINPFLESTLKLNGDYRFAIVTGTNRITKGSIFGRLDNLNEFNVLERRYSNHFGFTEDEVLSLLDNVGLPESLMDEIRNHCGRYRFGDHDVFNPYDVIRFLDSASDGDIGFQPHLIDNKDRSLIIDALRRTINGFIDEIKTLEMEGHSIHTCLNPCLSYKALD